MAEQAQYNASKSPSSQSTDPIGIEVLPSPLSVTYTDHDDAFELADDLAGSEQEMYSQYAWVSCGDGIWVLELHFRGFIRIEPDDSPEGPQDVEAEAQEGPLYKAKYTPANFLPGKSPYMPSRLLFTGLALAPAIRACDSFVVSKVYVKTAPTM